MALGSAMTVCGRVSTELRALGSRAIATAMHLSSPPLTVSTSLSNCIAYQASSYGSGLARTAPASASSKLYAIYSRSIATAVQLSSPPLTVSAS